MAVPKKKTSKMKSRSRRASNWVLKPPARSICPQCTTKALQQSDYAHYRCFNCHTRWRVTPSRFCRAYRTTKDVPLTPNPLFT